MQAPGMSRRSSTRLALSLTLGLALTPMAFAASGKCDRKCLDQTVDDYIAALVAHAPDKVDIAENARFVENTEPRKIGEGLWKTATAGPTTFQIHVPDPTSQQVGFLGVMQENGKPIDVAIRLKLEQGKITEIEHLIVRDLSPASLKNLEKPRPGLLRTVPQNERTPHDQLLKIGASYYEALVSADANDAPFAEDCERHENGMITVTSPEAAAQHHTASNFDNSSATAKLSSMGCEKQLKTHLFDYIKRIEPRRVWIADVETGLVFGLSQFRHPMKESSVKIVGVPGLTERELKGRNGQPIKPFDMPAAHVFKVRGGKMHEIEAIGITIPYDSKTGWEQ